METPSNAQQCLEELERRFATGRLDGGLTALLLRAADISYAHRHYATCCDYADRALQLLDDIADATNTGVDREARLRAMTLFAAASRMLGRLQDAELTIQIALMEAESALGEEHPLVVAARAELDLIYAAINHPRHSDRGWKRAADTWPGLSFNPAA
jgi:hypothetical protein